MGQPSRRSSQPQIFIDASVKLPRAVLNSGRCSSAAVASMPTTFELTACMASTSGAAGAGTALIASAVKVASRSACVTLPVFALAPMVVAPARMELIAAHSGEEVPYVFSPLRSGPGSVVGVDEDGVGVGVGVVERALVVALVVAQIGRAHV